jgi:hypothetical protein
MADYLHHDWLNDYLLDGRWTIFNIAAFFRHDWLSSSWMTILIMANYLLNGNLHCSWLFSPWLTFLIWLTIFLMVGKSFQYGWQFSPWLTILIMADCFNHEILSSSWPTDPIMHGSLSAHEPVCVCTAESWHRCQPLQIGAAVPFVPQNCLSEENNSEGDTDLGSDLTLLEKREEKLYWLGAK